MINKLNNISCRLPRFIGKQFTTSIESLIFKPTIEYPFLWTKTKLPGGFDDFTRAVAVNSISVECNFKFTKHSAVKILQQVKKFKDFMLTPTKEFILNELLILSDELVRNEYEGKSGNASRLLYGEKGIGISSSLQFSAAAIAACHPYKIIPIYVEYIGNSATFQTPSALISNMLELFHNVSISMCLEKLNEKGQFVFLIVNKIDQLYMSVDDEVTRLKILMELAELGSQRSGRVFTIVRGSASCTSMLISKNAVYDTMLRTEYPLVKNSPNLNSSKYSSLRVDHKTNQIKAEFDVIASHYQITTACDVLYFLAGRNLRRIDKIVNIMRYSSKTNLVKQVFEIIKPPKLCDQQARKIFEENKDIVRALNSALVEKNYDILRKAYCNHQNILKIKWIDELNYLNFDEVQKVANTVGCKNYQFVINSLVDKGYYSADCDLQNLGPGKPLDLLYIFPMFAKETWIRSLYLMLFGVVVEADKDARQQLIITGIETGLKYIKHVMVINTKNQ